MIVDFEDFEFLIEPTSEENAAVPVDAGEDGFMFFSGSAYMFDSGVFVLFLALESVIFFLIEVVFDVELMLSISDLGPVFKLVLFLVEAFKFSLVLFLAGILGEC